MICHLTGRSLAQTESATIAALRAQARLGVHNHDLTSAQAMLLLNRQLRQVPRWLQQSRYNRPPPPRRDPRVLLQARNYATNPVMSADGLHVVFNGYQAKPLVAKVAGEISVVDRDLATGRSTPIRLPAQHDGRPNPSSSYNPSVSANGRFVAFEASLGNLNFAKRYGEIRIYRRDLRSGRDVLVSRAGSAPASDHRSAYSPSVSADGRYVAYEAADSKPGGNPGSYRLDIYVRDMASGRSGFGAALLRRRSGAAAPVR